MLCVGGRLAHAILPGESKYQRLIPQNSHLARLVVSNAHLSTLHGGTTQVMAHICTRFWIPSCRSLVRKLVLNCVGRNRFNVKPQYPLMGDLPKERVDVPTKAFKSVGIDFAGRSYVENRHGMLSSQIWHSLSVLQVKLCISRQCPT